MKPRPFLMRLGVPFGDWLLDKPFLWSELEDSGALRARLPNGLLEGLPWLGSPGFLAGLLLLVLNLGLEGTFLGLILRLLWLLFGLLLGLGIACLQEHAITGILEYRY